MRHLPGTKIEIQGNEYRSIFDAIFLTGGITLSQLSNITGLEAHTVQNWVKRKYITAPVGKKYNQNQLCRIIIINVLKEVFAFDDACSLIGYVNLLNKDDGLGYIDESELYFRFVEVLFNLDNENEDIEVSILKVFADFVDNGKGNKKRFLEVLEIMVSAYISYNSKQKATILYRSIVFHGNR